jgi:nicotinamide mononucleotide transporter
MQSLLAQLAELSIAETIAAALGLAYLLLAVRRNLWCWLCAFVSTAIYFVLFAQAKLYMQSALQLFYLAMAVYGYVEWRRGRSEEGEVLIRSWPLQAHLLACAGVVVATAVNAWLLMSATDAVAPVLDSFVTWGSVVTTWMVARRLIENWLYWVVIDTLAAYLYFTQGFLPTALLFVLYTIIVIRGYFAWRKQQRRQTAETVESAVSA